MLIPKGRRYGRIDKSQLAIPVFTRWRSSVHLGHVGCHRCCIPGCNRPAQVHHLLWCPEPKSRSEKPSDYWTAPLCHEHHLGQTGVHHHGNERVWCQIMRIDLIAIATSLQRSSPVAEAIARHLATQTGEPR